MPTKWLRASLLSGIDKILREHFFLTHAQLDDEIAFDFDLLENPEHKLPLVEAIKVLDDCASYTGCQYFGALLANEQNNEHLSLMYSLAESCNSFEEAFNEVLNHFIKQANGFELQYFKDAFNVYTIIHLDNVSKIDPRQAVLFGLVRLFKFFKKITRNEWCPTHVYFTFAAPNNIQYLKQVLGVELHFNMSFSGFIFPDKQFSIEMSAQNNKLNTALKDFLVLTGKSPSTNKLIQIKQSIRRLLILEQRCRLIDIAKSQHQTTRALQYYLKKHQVTYQQLLDNVRYDLAREMLVKTENSIYKISSLIGFSDSTVFTRSFKKHFGQSPTKYRREYQDLKYVSEH